MTNPHPTLNQSHNTGGIGASNQEVFSQRGSGLVSDRSSAMTFDRQSSGEYGTQPVASTVAARDYKCAADLVVDRAAAFAQNTRNEVRLVGGDGSLVGALAAQPGMKQTSYVAVSTGGDIAHTLNTANNGKGCSEDGTGRGVPTIAHTVALRGRAGGATAEIGGEVATALRASSGGGDKPHVLATMEVAGTMKACAGTSGGWSNSADHAAAGYMQVDHNLAVRRLTPTECERLQGFPDGHTDVPYRKKPAADGPRYKALGNSMAVPVMAWIGRRIANYVA